MGLARLAECALRLRQPWVSGATPAPRRALATGLGARGGQTATAIVLEAA
jgi:hypothetical protein